MKIAYVTDHTIPSRSASSIHIMKMCQAFSRVGHEVYLLQPNKLRDDDTDVYAYYGVEKTFRIRKLPWYDIPGKRILFGILILPHLKKIAPDVVYSRSIYPCFTSVLFCHSCIFESHTPISDHGRVAELIFSLMIKNRNLKRFVVISHSLKNHYRTRFNITENTLTIAPDGADEPVRNENTNAKKSPGLKVGYVGHMYPGKGMEIISQLVQLCPWANFHCVGGMEEDIGYWKTHLKNTSNVFFHGFIPPSQTDRYRHSFDILLAPYQRNVSIYKDDNADIAKWMSPLKIFEYMAAGKPIICSDLPVIREILTDKQTALLCDPDDIDSWVAAIEQLYNAEHLRKRLGQAALAKFRDKYTWQKRAAYILKGVCPRT